MSKSLGLYFTGVNGVSTLSSDIHMANPRVTVSFVAVLVPAPLVAWTPKTIVVEISWMTGGTQNIAKDPFIAGIRVPINTRDLTVAGVYTSTPFYVCECQTRIPQTFFYSVRNTDGTLFQQSEITSVYLELEYDPLE